MSNLHPVIALLDSLGATLTEGKISVAELTQQVGEVYEQPGGTTTYVTPRDPLFREITIGVWRGETRPRIISLKAADPKQFPSLAALKEHYGKYGMPMRVGRAPQSAIFRRDFGKSRPWVANIGATLVSEPGVELEQSSVSEIYIDTERR